MNRIILIALLVGMMALIAAPVLAAIPVHARSADSPEPVIIRVVPRTVAWVMRPSFASTVVVYGHPPVIVPGAIVIGGFFRPPFPIAHYPPPVYVQRVEAYGPPTFFP